MNNTLRRKLEEISSGEAIFDCSLARYTSFAIGGPADALIVIKRRKDLILLLQCLKEEELPWRVIGKGSNLLVKDDGFRGVVIILGGEFTEIATDNSRVDTSIELHVGAGCSLTKLNRYCCRNGYAGLTFSYGIPGTVGGAVLMNAGAWGKEFSSVVTEIGVITDSGYEKLSGEQLDFTYRGLPYFKNYVGRGVIVDALLSVANEESQVIEDEMKMLLQKRKAIQPHNYPNGGSCFKNPKEKSAGRLIEECDLKGTSVGGAMVSEKHANFIINYNKATAKDVLTLVQRVQRAVRSRFDIHLETEIHVM